MNLVRSLLGALALLSTAVSSDTPPPVIGTTTIIKAVLTQKIISDYPGPFRCYITHDVYDTKWEYILIPKGSVCHGQVVRISNVNESISARVGYIIKSIERPDGILIDMTKDAAVDHEGVSGVKDEVDHHFFAQFMGVIAYALISTGADDTQTGGLTGHVDVQAEAANEVRQQFKPLAAKYLRLVPTITINSGQSFNIFVEQPKKIKPFRSIYDEITG